MNTHKMKLVTLVIFFSFLVPGVSQAYFTTKQSAVKLTDNTALYTVTYHFGFEKRGLYMPIAATRSAEVPAFGAAYTLLNNDEELLSDGISSSIILTGDEAVEIKNGQYYLEPGESATFTLVSLLTLTPEMQMNNLEASLLVSHLPFTMIIGNDEVNNQLNPSELKYYRTPAVEF